MDLADKLRFLTGEADEYAPITDQPVQEPTDFHVLAGRVDDELDIPEDLSINRYLRLDDSKGKSKKKKSSIFDDFDEQDEEELSHRGVPKKIKSEKLYRKLTKRMSDDMIADFEDFLGDDTLYESEESEELKNGLISLGRKYARSTATSAESAEVQKTFAGSEEKLKAIYDDITRDLLNVGRDIDQMRAATRGRNYKVISELTSSKTSLHQARISAVREMNAVKKAQFDMKLKEKASATGSDANADISPSSLKALFGAGRSQIMGATGGYSSVVGPSSGGYSDASNYDMTDEEIEAAYFSGDDDTEITEGDRYLEYESLDPHYELAVDDMGKPVEIRAVDRDGNLLPDYPIPNMNGLHFEINNTTNEATDDLHRVYRIVPA